MRANADAQLDFCEIATLDPGLLSSRPHRTTGVVESPRGLSPPGAPRSPRWLGAGGLVCLLQVLQDLHAAFVVVTADIGQADPPGRAVQHTHAERITAPA